MKRSIILVLIYFMVQLVASVPVWGYCLCISMPRQVVL